MYSYNGKIEVGPNSALVPISSIITANLGATLRKIHRMKLILTNIIVYVTMSYEIVTP